MAEEEALDHYFLKWHRHMLFFFFFYITVVLGQTRGSSKEVCLAVSQRVTSERGLIKGASEH